MPRHDLVCSRCGTVVKDVAYKLPWPEVLIHIDTDSICLGGLEILWSTENPGQAAVCERERTVVYYHPKLGYRYPGRNDSPMPDYYQRAGFERKELPHLSDIKKLEKDGNVLSEINHFDKGTGRDFLYNS